MATSKSGRQTSRASGRQGSTLTASLLLGPATGVVVLGVLLPV